MYIEKSTKHIKPLGMESIMANTILDYVINNPDETDHMAAYNDWVESVAIRRGFPISDQRIAQFALSQFDVYINKCSRESLLLCRDIEEEMFRKTYGTV